MEWIAAIALDFTAVWIVIYCAHAAAKKGFLRTVVQMAAYVGVLAFSSHLSGEAAPVIYERVVEQMIFESSQSQDDRPRELKNADLVSFLPGGMLAMDGGWRPLLPARGQHSEEPESLSLDDLEQLGVDLDSLSLEDLKGLGIDLKGLDLDSLDRLGIDTDTLDPDQLGAFGLEKLREFGIDPDNLGLDDLKRLAQELPEELEQLLPEGIGPEEIVKEIADNTLRPVLIKAIGTVSFVVIFAALSMLSNLLLSMLGVINSLPVIGFFNSTLGAVVGILQGVLIVWVVGLLFKGLFYFSPDGWWIFNSDVVGSTFLFRYFMEPGLLRQLG